jgi:hypothetical protein
MKLLSKEKLSLIFQLQLHQVYQLFHLDGGRFRFDELGELQDRILTIPWLEMTGHRIKTTEASMYALRLIENWDIFAEQLPEANLALKRSVEQPHLKLTSTERKVWELADGTTSLITMCQVAKQPLKSLQITAFRLIAVGLIEEIFISSYNWEKLEHEVVQRDSSVQLNYQKTNKLDSAQTSFLPTLIDFLKRVVLSL